MADPLRNRERIRCFLNIIPTDHDRIELMFADTEPRVKARTLAAYPDYPCTGRPRWRRRLLGARRSCTRRSRRTYADLLLPLRLRAAFAELQRLSRHPGNELLAVFGMANDLLGRAGLLAVTDTKTVSVD